MKSEKRKIQYSYGLLFFGVRVVKGTYLSEERKVKNPILLWTIILWSKRACLSEERRVKNPNAKKVYNTSDTFNCIRKHPVLYR